MDTYEQKYNKLVEKLKKASVDNDWCDERFCCVISSLFPELVESEDERIRNVLVELVKGNERCGHFMINNITTSSMIAWLEKQGEKPQGKSALEAIKEEKVDNANKVEPKDYSSIDPHFFKPVDKVGPKFHKGDWVIHQGTENIYQVVVVIDNQYQLKYGDNYTIQKCADVDRCARLWDITKDARDGDILVSKSNQPFIYNGHFDTSNVGAYCGLNYAGKDFLIANELCDWTSNDNIKPATKEQRDQLEEAMAYAGYRWKAETKELIKIPKLKKPTGVLKELIDDDKNHIDSLLKRLTGLCRNEFERTRFAISEDQDWLESLKERLS